MELIDYGYTQDAVETIIQDCSDANVLLESPIFIKVMEELELKLFNDFKTSSPNLQEIHYQLKGVQMLKSSLENKVVEFHKLVNIQNKLNSEVTDG